MKEPLHVGAFSTCVRQPDKHAFLHALTWALIALTLGLAIFGAFYLADVLHSEHQARRKRHFGGV